MPETLATPPVHLAEAQTVQTGTTPTSTTLSSDKNPAYINGYVTFTATVTGTSPTGAIHFMNGTTEIETKNIDHSGRAAVTTSQLSMGTHSIVAQYVGDSVNAPSMSVP
jgi:hypothetical protein